MDKDTKESLDRLALKLQKALINDALVPDYYGYPMPNDPKATTWRKAHSSVILYINEEFGTHYEASHSRVLEHFREKPCEIQGY